MFVSGKTGFRKYRIRHNPETEKTAEKLHNRCTNGG